MKTMIRNARVLVHAQRCVKEEAVLIEDGTILDIASECELPYAEQVIDAEGLYLAPGLLDTHTHGIGGFDFNTCTVQAIEEIIALEHAEGVNGFLASLVVENHAMTMERLQLLEYFDAFSTAELSRHIKPAPDIFLKAAELLGCSCAECLAIEDSRNGLIAADKAGMPCLIVPNKITESSDFTGCYRKVSSLKELKLKELIADFQPS